MLKIVSRCSSTESTMHGSFDQEVDDDPAEPPLEARFWEVVK